MNGHRDDEKVNGHRDHNRGNEIDGQIDDDLNLPECTSVSFCDKKTLDLILLEINTLQPEMQKCLSNRADANNAETGEIEMMRMVIDIITENTDADMMTYSKHSGRYSLTIEIDEKQVPDDIADDFELKTLIKDKPQPDDEDLLKCKICGKNMALKHNIHNIKLLFQFYKCSCPLLDNHMIVNYKRDAKWVVHESKGMWNYFIAQIKHHILSGTIRSSTNYYAIKRLTNDSFRFDPSPEAFVAEDQLASHERMLDDVADDIERLSASGVMARLEATVAESMASRNAVGLRHVMRLFEAEGSFRAFYLWFDTFRSVEIFLILTEAIKYLNLERVRTIGDSQLDDFRMLNDMIAGMSLLMTDLSDMAAKGEYERPSSLEWEAHTLVATLLEGDQMAYQYFSWLLQAFIDKNLVTDGVARDCVKVFRATYEPPSECEIVMNVIDADIRVIAASIIDIMFDKLEICVRMAKTARSIEKNDIQKKQMRRILAIN